MYKISAQQATKFLNETNKYIALFNLCNYLEDTCTKEERLEAVGIRKAVEAALALKYAMENDKEGIAAAFFSNQFTALWEFIVQYCKKCSTEWIVEITEVLQKRVHVVADSEAEAIEIVTKEYKEGSIQLIETDLVNTEIELSEEQ